MSPSKVKSLKNLLLLLLSLHLLGCAIAIPVHQNHTPQSLGSGGIELSVLSNSGPSIGPDFEEGSSLSTTTAENLSELSPSTGLHLGVGLTNSLDLELETLFSFFSGSVVTAGLKYQWLGQPLFAGKSGETHSSLRLRYFAASGFSDDSESGTNDSLFDNIYVEELDGSGFILSNSFGYLVTDFFGAYVGGQYIQGSLDYRYREDDSTGTLYTGDRTISGYGPFLGLHLNSVGSRLRFYLSLEFQLTNMPATFSDKKVWSESFSSSLGVAFSL